MEEEKRRKFIASIFCSCCCFVGLGIVNCCHSHTHRVFSSLKLFFLFYDTIDESEFRPQYAEYRNHKSTIPEASHRYSDNLNTSLLKWHFLHWFNADCDTQPIAYPTAMCDPLFSLAVLIKLLHWWWLVGDSCRSTDINQVFRNFPINTCNEFRFCSVWHFDKWQRSGKKINSFSEIH